MFRLKPVPVPPSLRFASPRWARTPTAQTVHENRIYSLKIVCGGEYPDTPPVIQFISRVNLPFVSQANGTVDPAKLAVLTNWNRNSSIETVLVEIRRSVSLLLL